MHVDFYLFYLPKKLNTEFCKNVHVLLNIVNCFSMNKRQFIKYWKYEFGYVHKLMTLKHKWTKTIGSKE